jgi:hypothetical protein
MARQLHGCRGFVFRRSRGCDNENPRMKRDLVTNPSGAVAAIRFRLIAAFEDEHARAPSDEEMKAICLAALAEAGVAFRSNEGPRELRL